MSEYLLPDVGEGLVEAEIVTWRVEVGDVVKVNDIVVEIETAKSIVELPSPYAGTVEALLVATGELVAVGTPIIRIADGLDGPAAPSVDPGEIDLSNPAASGGGEGESLVGRNKPDRAPVRRARKGGASPATDAGANIQLQLQAAYVPGQPAAVDVVATDEPVVPSVSARAADTSTLAKPPVRMLARELGVDLATCTATGPGGVVTRADVESAAAGRAAVPVVAASPHLAARPASGDRADRREPIKGVRKMMGQAMVASAFSAPHVTEWITVDVTRTTEFVDRLRTRHEFAEVKVSALLVLATACVRAISRTPVINSYWDEAAQEVVFKGAVNLGIAAATPRGLVVPNIKDADTLSLIEMAGALADLTSVARQGKTQPADMAGGTFTITNVGVFGIDGGTPIINPGESAILCFGATKRQPWVVTASDGTESLQIRDVATLTLSFDHRHVDGEAGSRFLADVASMMEEPAAALLF